MKRLSLILLIATTSNSYADQYRSAQLLGKYQHYLENGTYGGQDWSSFTTIPLSRYHTFKFAFEHFEKNNGKVIVELGTSRSFVDGAYEGCNENDPMYWQPRNPAVWDWGAGLFTRVAAECLQHVAQEFHTIDLISSHIQRCKLITKDFAKFMKYHVVSSVDFLKKFHKKIDLLYVDTGDMTPIEPTAKLQLEEAKVIVERDLIAPHGIILIDDVKNQTPRQFGEKSPYGKAKYSLPYFLAHGFELVADEYQVILRKLPK